MVVEDGKAKKITRDRRQDIVPGETMLKIFLSLEAAVNMIQPKGICESFDSVLLISLIQ
jgi:hypothetical protein